MQDELKSKLKKTGAGGGVVALVIYILSVVQTNAAEEKKQLMNLVEEKFKVVSTQIANIEKTQDRTLSEITEIRKDVSALNKNTKFSLEMPKGETNKL